MGRKKRTGTPARRVRVDTAPRAVCLEIEGGLYPVLPRTPESERRMALAASVAGRPERLRAEISAAIGAEAARRLFLSGGREDLRRMERIRDAALSAWRGDDERDARREADARAVAEALAPVNELLRRLCELEGRDRVRLIRRGKADGGADADAPWRAGGRAFSAGSGPEG